MVALTWHDVNYTRYINSTRGTSSLFFLFKTNIYTQRGKYEGANLHHYPPLITNSHNLPYTPSCTQLSLRLSDLQVIFLGAIQQRLDHDMGQQVQCHLQVVTLGCTASLEHLGGYSVFHLLDDRNSTQLKQKQKVLPAAPEY